MLSESFIACCGLPSVNGKKSINSSATVKDATIAIHGLAPRANVHQLFKKSAVKPNCVGLSDEHIFTAQADKAIVNVYSRERGNQECIIPFQEKITALTVVCDGTVVVMGTEGGRLMLWETCTGRIVSTLATHLQAVTCVAGSTDSNIIVSGSADCSLHTWSVPSLLAFGGGSSNLSPIASMTAHRTGITALALSESTGAAGIAVSCSSDGNTIVSDYSKGVLLRLFLLAEAPTSLVLDPADRGFYVGFNDGTIQLVDFYDIPNADSTNGKHPLYADDAAMTPIQPPASSRWTAQPSVDSVSSPILSICLSWDGTTLLSGSVNGQVSAWDVGRHTWRSVIVTMPGPVTALQAMPVEGWPGQSRKRQRRLRVDKVVKPKFELDTSERVQGKMPDNYTLTAQLVGDIEDEGYSSADFWNSQKHPEFDRAFACSTGFPQDILEDSINELSAWKQQSQGFAYVEDSVSARSGPTMASSGEFMMFDDGTAKAQVTEQRTPNGSQVPKLTLEEQNSLLKQKIAALQRVQRITFKHLNDLRAERTAYFSKSREEGRQAEHQNTMDVDDPSAQLTAEAFDFVEAEEAVAEEEHSSTDGERSQHYSADNSDNSGDDTSDMG